MLSVAGWTAEQNQIMETVISEALFRCHVCLPCIVQSYNSSKNTIECQPTIREKIVDESGKISYKQYPMLLDVPVIFPSTKICSITFPIAKGDEVLVLFSDLAIDNFWAKGSIQNPIEVRRHDLSDGIAIPCCLSLTKNPNNCSVGIEISNQDITLKTASGSITVSQLMSMYNFFYSHVHTTSTGYTGGPTNA